MAFGFLGLRQPEGHLQPLLVSIELPFTAARTIQAASYGLLIKNLGYAIHVG